MRIVSAFKYGDSLKIGNSRTDGQKLWLHDNLIAEKRNGSLWITQAGWDTNTTNERLNGLSGVNIYHKRGRLFLNDKEWDGEWINVNNPEAKREEDGGSAGFKSIAMVAKMGEIFHTGDKKAVNDWKVRMLKAGLSSRGLEMPEDWDTLTEEEKEKRLNAVIGELNK